MYRIFDIHTHIYPDTIAERAVASLGRFYDFVPAGNGSYDDMTRADRKFNVCGFLVFSVATNARQVKKVNEALAAVARRAREDGFQAVAYGGLHQDCEDMRGEIEYALSLGLRGIKIHPDIQRVDIDSPKLYPLYEMAEGNFPVYFHMGDDREEYRFSEAVKLRRVLDAFPRLKVVAAHLGGYMATDEGLEYLAGDENVWYDTSSALWTMSPARAGYLIERYGHKRIMFGTDYPVMYPDSELERFLMIELDEDKRRDILYNNAAEFLALTAD